MEESRFPLLTASSLPAAAAEESITFADDDYPPPAADHALNGDLLAGCGCSSQPPPASPNTTDPNLRLASLDVFRGFTVALMILVDHAGGAFPSINHLPWFGLTLADFVMPFFLFVVGASVGLVFKKVSNKRTATMKILVRTIKLYVPGLVLQVMELTYPESESWVYYREFPLDFLAALSEIWLINQTSVDSSAAFMKKYYIQWLVVILLTSLYLALFYGLYVPNWEFDTASTTSTLRMAAPGTKVDCAVKGNLQPPCNAAGLVDRFFLGNDHLYQHPVYRRTKECGEKSPDYGPLPPNSPRWCLAPFDPEGLLRSLMAAVTCFIGLCFGHVIVHCKNHWLRILSWTSFSLLVLLSGFVLELLGIALSKPLYSLSYTCITSGVAGFLLTFIYYIVDVRMYKKPLVLLQWMGMNALIVLAACELFPAALQGFYWRSPENNLVNATEQFRFFFGPDDGVPFTSSLQAAPMEGSWPHGSASKHVSSQEERYITNHWGTVARRALFQSKHRRISGKKTAIKDAKPLPSSRLSNMSTAVDDEVVSSTEMT